MQYYFMMEHCGEMVNMNEEQVTKQILSWLLKNNWKIICYDFPQSGTGRSFKPSSECQDKKTKNKNHIIPDILAVKNGIMLLFENKSYFYLDDFLKIDNLRRFNCYDKSINEFLNRLKITDIVKYYGIGSIDDKKFYDKASIHYQKTDFVINVNQYETCITYNPLEIPFG